MTDYNTYYKTPDLFGEPYPELIDFFSHFEPKGKVLDLGCGQGRDSIHLARLGYQVTGIDTSKVGIAQMKETSKKEGLTLTGLVGDIYEFENYQDFDVVLLDSMFHFAKNDKKQETGLINKILKLVSIDTIVCICIQDTGKKVKMLKDTIESSGVNFKVLRDASFIYSYEDKKSAHKSDTKYYMLILSKQ